MEPNYRSDGSDVDTEVSDSLETREQTYDESEMVKAEQFKDAGNQAFKGKTPFSSCWIRGAIRQGAG